MSYLHGARSSGRIPLELVEADCEIGFSLVEIAEADSIRGDPDRAARVIADAERVFLDIEQRLAALPADERQCFAGLIGELRREIEMAREHMLAT